MQKTMKTDLYQLGHGADASTKYARWLRTSSIERMSTVRYVCGVHAGDSGGCCAESFFGGWVVMNDFVSALVTMLERLSSRRCDAGVYRGQGPGQ